MAQVVSTLFISLDGVVEIDPAWHFPYFDEHMGRAVGEDYADVDVLLLGRVTYDSFAGAWPDREAAGGEDSTFAAQLGDLRKVVATRGDADLGWRNAERVSGDLGDAVGAAGVVPPGQDHPAAEAFDGGHDPHQPDTQQRRNHNRHKRLIGSAAAERRAQILAQAILRCDVLSEDRPGDAVCRRVEPGPRVPGQEGVGVTNCIFWRSGGVFRDSTHDWRMIQRERGTGNREQGAASVHIHGIPLVYQNCGD